jgi:hypothetical protein
MRGETPDGTPLTSAQLLDLLLDALLERQATRKGAATEAERGPGQPPAQTAPSPVQEAKRPARVAREKAPPRRKGRREPRPGEAGWEPPPRLPTIHLDRMLVRFLVLIAVLIIVVNVPVTRYGVSLARIMPDSASLIIRDGLLLKGSGPEIYMMEEDRLRWISSLDAFEHLGLTWGDVHVVEDEFVERFEKGRPIHVLLKCRGSPHIYRLENQQKRWIKDIDTFLAEGHVWEDVRFVDCGYLRGIPDGPPLPEDAGPPPQP